MSAPATMRSLPPVGEGPMRLRSTSMLGLRYELRVGAELAGVLQGSFWGGSPTVLQTAQGTFRLFPSAGWSHAEVRLDGAQGWIARLRIPWFGSAEIQLADGRVLHQKDLGRMGSRWAWLDEQGGVVCSFDGGLMARSTTLEEGPSSRTLDLGQQTAVLLLGVWLIQLRRSLAETAVASVGAVLL